MPTSTRQRLAGPIGFQNGLTNASIHWNLGNGFNFDESVGVYWASDSGLADAKSRFLGHTDVAYIAWRLGIRRRTSFTARVTLMLGASQSYFNYDLAAVRKLGKFEVGVVAYGTTDLDNGITLGGCGVTQLQAEPVRRRRLGRI